MAKTQHSSGPQLESVWKFAGKAETTSGAHMALTEAPRVKPPILALAPWPARERAPGRPSRRDPCELSVASDVDDSVPPSMPLSSASDKIQAETRRQRRRYVKNPGQMQEGLLNNGHMQEGLL